MKRPSTANQDFLGLDNFRIRNTAIYRTRGGTFLAIEEADALGAFTGDDIVNVLGERRLGHAIQFPGRSAFVNRVVRTTRQTCSAVDAFLRDNGSHGQMRFSLRMNRPTSSKLNF